MSAATYHGEDVNALVVDFGSHTLRMGYGGEFEPKLVVPAVVGKIVETKQVEEPQSKTDKNNNDDMDTSTSNEKTKEHTEKTKTVETVRYLVGDQLHLPRENIDISRPVKQGVIEDLEGYKAVIRYAYKQLNLNPKDHPLIISEPVWNNDQKREQAAKFFFDELQVPAIQILKAPILALFSQAKSTGIVVDVGFSGVSITPIVEGQIIKQGILRNLFGGEFLRNQCHDWLSQKSQFPEEAHQHFWPIVLPYQIGDKKEVTDSKPPNYTIKETAKSISPSWRKLQEENFFEDFCRQVVQVSDKSLTQVEIMNMANRHFEFPNGYHLDINNQRIQIGELMFDPSMLSGNSMLGITTLMVRSSKICETDARQQLLSNIHLVGGGSCIAGLADRLNNEIAFQVGHKYRLIQPATYSSGGLHRQPPYVNNERKYATWIGGSIIASMGSFHNMWVSREEWAELGADSFEKKNWIG